MDNDGVQSLIDLGLNAIFLYLYLRERARVREVQEDRIKECKEYADHYRQAVPPYPLRGSFKGLQDTE